MMYALYQSNLSHNLGFLVFFLYYHILWYTPVLCFFFWMFFPILKLVIKVLIKYYLNTFILFPLGSCIRLQWICTLSEHSKRDTKPMIYRSLLAKARDDMPPHIYTNGSIAAAFFAGSIYSNRLPDFASIFFSRTTGYSLSLTYFLSNFKIKIPSVLEILQLYYTVQSKEKKLTFVWVPVHAGFTGDEIADRVAKLTLLDPITISQVPYTDFSLMVFQYIFTFWQSECDLQFLLNVMPPTLG